MSSATLTTKGQVTIPIEVRRKLNLRAGDRLLFEVEQAVVHLRVVPRRRLTEFFGAFPATKPFPGKAAVRREVANARGKARATRLEELS